MIFVKAPLMRKTTKTRTKEIAMSSSTDTEQLCYTCGCMGHRNGQCALNKISITLQAAPGMNEVEFVDSNNFWRRGFHMNYVPEEGMFKIKIFLSPGYHEFKFLINSSEWVLSNRYPTIVTKQGAVNNYGIVEPVSYPFAWLKAVDSERQTAIIVIAVPKYSYKSMLKNLNLLICKEVIIEVLGSWDNWQNAEKMEYVEKSDKCMEIYLVTKELPIKNYEYKFRVNGKWILDPFRNLTNSDPAPNHPLSVCDLIIKSFKHLLKPQISVNEILEYSEFNIENIEIFTLYGHSMNLINSKIWVFGGYHSNSFMGSMIQIDPVSLSASIVQTFNGPERLGFHKSLTYGNKIIMFGGQKDEIVEYKYFTFNTETKTWTTSKIKNMPDKREMFSLAHRKDTPLVYLFGGYYCSNDLKVEKNFNDLSVLHLDHMTFESLDCVNPPEPRCHHSTTIIDSDMYLFGGMQVVHNNKICYNDFYKLALKDHNNLEWIKLDVKGDKPTPRYGHLSLAFGTQIIIHGGTTFDLNTNANVYLWDMYVLCTKRLISYNVKLDGSLVELGRAFHAGCIHGNTIVIFGGKFYHNLDKNR